MTSPEYSGRRHYVENDPMVQFEKTFFSNAYHFRSHNSFHKAVQQTTQNVFWTIQKVRKQYALRVYI